MEQLEAWINIREPVMKEKNVGENIQAVEELLRRQDDFEKTVDAQSEKFNSICRRTQVTLYQLAADLFHMDFPCLFSRKFDANFHICTHKLFRHHGIIITMG